MFAIRNRQEYYNTGTDQNSRTYDAAWGYAKAKEPTEGWTCLGDVFQFKTEQAANEYAAKHGIELGFFEGELFTNLVSIVPIEAVIPIPLPVAPTPNETA